MVRGAKGAGGPRINQALLESFVKWFDSLDYSNSSNTESLEIEDYLLWDHAGTVAQTTAIVDMLMEKARVEPSNNSWQSLLGLKIERGESSLQDRCIRFGSHLICIYEL